jgi:hypothetical protein
VILVLCLVVGVLVIVASAAGSVRPIDGSKNQWSSRPLPTRTPGPRPEELPPGDWWSGVWTALLYLAVFVFAVLIVVMIYLAITTRSTNRRPKPMDPEQPPDEQLIEAVETGLAAIDRGTPNDAVIACWVALEDAAAAAGVARDASETAAEFTVRVLALNGVSAADLHTLADLYREARYSDHASTEETRTKAHAALSSLRDDLTATNRSWRPWR